MRLIIFKQKKHSHKHQLRHGACGKSQVKLMVSWSFVTQFGNHIRYFSLHLIHLATYLPIYLFVYLPTQPSPSPSFETY